MRRMLIEIDKMAADSAVNPETWWTFARRFDLLRKPLESLRISSPLRDRAKRRVKWKRRNSTPRGKKSVGRFSLEENFSFGEKLRCGQKDFLIRTEMTRQKKRHGFFFSLRKFYRTSFDASRNCGYLNYHWETRSLKFLREYRDKASSFFRQEGILVTRIPL